MDRLRRTGMSISQMRQYTVVAAETGEVVEASIARQTELVLEQMKLCLETAGSSFEH